MGMEPFMELSRRARSLRRLTETRTAGGVGQSQQRSMARRAELSSTVMRSSITDAYSGLLAPLSIGDRLPWKLDHEAQRPGRSASSASDTSLSHSSSHARRRASYGEKRRKLRDDDAPPPPPPAPRSSTRRRARHGRRRRPSDRGASPRSSRCSSGPVNALLIPRVPLRCRTR